jgi:hypothetical protein
VSEGKELNTGQYEKRATLVRDGRPTRSEFLLEKHGGFPTEQSHIKGMFRGVVFNLTVTRSPISPTENNFITFTFLISKLISKISPA